MIKVYGHPVSTCTRKVLTALAETNTPYELQIVDLGKGEHKQEPHLSRQPFGQIPTIDDDGFTLYESRAICRYVSAKAGDALVPANIKDRARMDQWLSIEQSNFSPYAMKFIFNYVFKRPQEARDLDAAREKVQKTFEVLSRPLESNEFVAGDRFTIADIAFMPYVQYFMGSPAEELVQKYPRVLAWWKRVSERPSWRKVNG